jgi:hypothetical protein
MTDREALIPREAPPLAAGFFIRTQKNPPQAALHGKI